MENLQKKYKKYLEDNPDSKISFEDWQKDILPPYVSDNFMIGPEGAFEYGQDDEDFSEWDVTLMDGLEDDNLKETFNDKKPALDNVLSLFDGMSCGQIALNRAGISYEKYYASEIDKHALKIAQHNYPNTIQLGDVTQIKGIDLPQVDLLIGGSPCQGFSFAGKQLNFEDPRSKLFFEFVRLLQECKPKYFLLENVRMKKEHKKVISEYLEVEPIEINSCNFVPQNRPRLYWTNIPIEPVSNKSHKLKNILLNDDFDDLKNLMLSKEGIDYMGRLRNGKPRWEYHTNPLNGNAACLTANMYKGIPYGVIKEKMRRLHPIECERLQGVPDNYTSSVSNTQRYKMLGNGWTVDVIAHIFDGIR